ncbi:MAG: glycerophosphodiester phosphodiesterase family protein [Actinobacteria bacterium]|nr:glycerophosphodiester phosphodiesterase family protein [Actinomycetota bacterium]
MFGQPQFAAMNSLVNDVFEAEKILVVAHRGSGGGSVAVNTELAVRAALLQGAGMVELDVTASSDGEFYCFHDGYEPEELGIERNLQTMTSAEIDRASYQWVDRPGRIARVERLLPLLKGFKDTRALFNLDRSWWRWPNLLKAIDGLYMAHQLVIKCPAWEKAALLRLREFGVKFPFVPICQSPDDVYRVLADPQLNTIGVELITTTDQHPWFSASVVDEFHDRGLFVFVNTVTLTTGIPLFGGHDDELAIASSPEAAYGPLLALGVDAIQTDWPAIVRDYRDTWLATSGRRVAVSPSAVPVDAG